MKYPFYPITIFFIALLFTNTVFQNQQKATLTLTVLGCKSDKGKVLVALYNSSETYLNEKKAFQRKIIPVEKGKAQIDFKGLPYGNYALACFHDANGNAKLDKNFIGFPKESYGFSNNPRIVFGPPGFEKSKVKIQSEKLAIEIKLNP